MTVKVLNRTSGDASMWVAINRWGNDGDTGRFPVKQGMTETWERSDASGFIMVVSIGKTPETARSASYFVQADSDIVVEDHKVTDKGRKISAHERPNAGAGPRLSVHNDTERKIDVAINHWGNDGETRFFPVLPNGDETWDRSDPRGFVMVIKRLGAVLQYFVAAGDKFVVTDDGVLRNDIVVKPLVGH